MGEAVQTVLESKLPGVNRALVRHIDSVQRDYMWNFVLHHWESIAAESDSTAVAYLLARRLALSLSDTAIAGLAKGLGSPFGNPPSAGIAHPMQFYVMPPIDDPPRLAGDIYMGDIRGRSGYWVMVTPTCDLVLGKAEYLLLAPCELLSEQVEYQQWVTCQSRRHIGELKDLLRNRRQGSQQDRHLFLPSAMDIPDLVVDLQKVETVGSCEFSQFELERLATLDSPFAEALTSQFSRLYGRIGTPNLDRDVVWERFENVLEAM